MISFSPVFVKIAAGHGVGPTAIGFWRTLIGCVILFVMAKGMGRPLLLPWVTLRFALLAGFFFFIDLYAWHRSIIYTGAGMATILANTQVFATTVFSYFVFSERVTGKFMAAAIAAFAGVCLLVGIGSADVQFTPSYTKGILFGLATGLAYAGSLICMKKGMVRLAREDAVVLMAWFSLFSALFLGVAGFAENDQFVPSGWQAVVSVVALGLMVQVLGWWTITSVISRVKTAQAGLILLLQPTLATLWGALLFAELLTPMQIAGAVVTLAAMYVGSTQRGNGNR